MKKLLLILLIGISTTSFGQNLSKELFNTIKNNDTIYLEKIIQKEKINDCYDIKGSYYNLIAVCIKMNATKPLEYLHNSGANIEAKFSGKTPLMYAVKYGKLEMVKSLITKGANLKAQHKGRTAFDYAKKYKHKDILKHLKQVNSN